MDIDQKIAELLVARKLLSEEQLKPVRQRMEQEGRSLTDLVHDMRLVRPEALAQAKAEALELPYVDLTTITRNEAAMKDISRQAAATYRFFAFDQSDGRLLVAMESPEDFQAARAVKFIAKKKGAKADLHVTTKEGIDAALGGAAEVQAEIGSALRDFGQELAEVDMGASGEGDIAKLIEEAPVTKVVAVIIRHAIDGAASDIHIEPSFKELRVRYRIDGKLHTSLLLPLQVHAAVVSRIKILSHLKIDESRLPQDGRFSSQASGRAFDFRVSTMPTVYGEKVVLRILDKTKGAPSFDELGLRGAQQEQFSEYLASPHGIILVSGPTGAGKSTTLFSALSSINRPDVNIVTLEDPVEYEVDGVNQTQTNPDIGLSFAAGLRNMLRQDPDVMMVGEIRDQETAALSVHASLTGHLVLATLHTNDAIGTVPRLIDMGIDPYLLTATLRLLLAQRLVARLCQACKEEQPIPENAQEAIAAELATVPDEYKTELNQQTPQHIYRSEGCPECNESGTAGRLAIFEVVPVTREIRDAISGSTEYALLHDVARQQGYITMRQDGILKSLAGEVLYEDVIRVTSESEAIV